MKYNASNRDEIMAAGNTLSGLQRIVEHDLRDQLRRVGSQWRARSPFVGPEGDRTPSFYLFEGRSGDGMFKCFSTGRGGNWSAYLKAMFPHSTPEERFHMAAQRLNIGPAIVVERGAWEPAGDRQRFFTYEEMADPANYNGGVFEQYTVDLFGEAGHEAMQRYGIGCSPDRWTNFWHIDVHGRGHGVKRARFRLNQDGKPTKKGKDGRAAVVWKYPTKEANVWAPCFGEHLLNGADPDTVYMVESEDSAVLLAADCIQRGENAVVLAAGGKSGYLNLFERLGAARPHMKEAHKLQRFVLIPDVDHAPTEEHPHVFEALKEAAFRHAMVNLEIWTLPELTRFAPYRDQIGRTWDIGDVFHIMLHVLHTEASEATGAATKRARQEA